MPVPEYNSNSFVADPSTVITNKIMSVTSKADSNEQMMVENHDTNVLEDENDLSEEEEDGVFIQA
jgi:hypothetical protein